MKLGLFLMPSHPPERAIAAGQEWDLQVLRWADELGYQEAWIGEHHTLVWEPNPAPDLLIAQAFLQTRNIRLGAGSFIAPYHHPVELAQRSMFLDSISNGRFALGVAPGAARTDAEMFCTTKEENRIKLIEAIEIIRLMFSDRETFEYNGEYWGAKRAKQQHKHFYQHLRGIQKPHPPIALTGGFSLKSETLTLAGKYGFRPMSFVMAREYLPHHWQSVLEGAAEAGRPAPSRSTWALSRDVFVAETDELAWEYAVQGPMGRMFEEYLLPFFKDIDIAKYFAPPGTPYSDITVEYVARNNWMIGSPTTVSRKIRELYGSVGGFGALLTTGFDYADNPAVYRRHMELLTQEVMPQVADLTGEEAALEDTHAAEK